MGRYATRTENGRWRCNYCHRVTNKMSAIICHYDVKKQIIIGGKERGTEKR